MQRASKMEHFCALYSLVVGAGRKDGVLGAGEEGCDDDDDVWDDEGDVM